MANEIEKYNSPMEVMNIDRSVLEQIQGFQKKFLQKNPNPKEVKINAMANNSKYLPISFVQMTMDEIFFGLWEDYDYKTSVIANEICGSITVRFFHPTAKVWLRRTGAASVPIQMKSKEKGGDGDITNIRNKIINGLVKDYPHVKSACITNACQSIGKIFGRDLNREFEDQYNPVINEPKPDPVEVLINEVRGLIGKLKDDKAEIYAAQLAEDKKAGKLNEARLKNYITKINTELGNVA